MNPTELPLRDLHLPEPIGWWPLAPGWWLVLGLLFVALAWAGWRAYCRWRAAAPRRHALRELKRLTAEYAQTGDAVAFARDASELLRRTMLAYAPRSEVAGLTGEAWLEFLDRDLERKAFVNGDGRPLVDWPYRPPGTPIDRSDVAAFVDALRLRLATPVGAAR